MVPMMISMILFLSIGAVNGDGTVVTVEQSITPSFDGGVDGIEVNCGGNCAVIDNKWFLSAGGNDYIEDWPIEVDLSGAFALSPGLSSISFTITGLQVHDEADVFMGFGDGEKYISFGVDFDDALGNLGSPNVKGLLVYPHCGAFLADGDVSAILSESNSDANTVSKRLRDALAGGETNDRNNMGQFTDELYNGNQWPVTIEIVNDEDNDQVTFKFSSDSLTEECTFDGAFDTDSFVYGVSPDGGNGDKDDFNIDSIDIAVTSTDDVPSCGGPVSVDDIVFTPRGYHWWASKSWCAKQGMELVSIHDEDSQNAVYEACKAGWLEGTSFSKVWLGLYIPGSSTYSAENFMWSDESNVDYNNWKDNQPNSESRKCVQMYCGGGGNQGGWTVSNCRWRQPYGICRKCSADDTSPAQVVPADPRFDDDFEDLRHFKMIDAMNDGAMDTAVISVSGQDLLILALLILNVVSLTFLVCKCTKCWNGQNVKYQAVLSAENKM